MTAQQALSPMLLVLSRTRLFVTCAAVCSTLLPSQASAETTLGLSLFEPRWQIEGRFLLSDIEKGPPNQKVLSVVEDLVTTVVNSRQFWSYKRTGRDYRKVTEADLSCEWYKKSLRIYSDSRKLRDFTDKFKGTLVCYHVIDRKNRQDKPFITCVLGDERIVSEYRKHNLERRKSYFEHLREIAEYEESKFGKYAPSAIKWRDHLNDTYNVYLGLGVNKLYRIDKSIQMFTKENEIVCAQRIGLIIKESKKFQ